LKGSAYAIVEGIDGRTHHLQFADLELTGDAAPGGIVEARVYEDAQGRKRLSLATRSDLNLRSRSQRPVRRGWTVGFSRATQLSREAAASGPRCAMPWTCASSISLPRGLLVGRGSGLLLRES